MLAGTQGGGRGRGGGGRVDNVRGGARAGKSIAGPCMYASWSLMRVTVANGNRAGSLSAKKADGGLGCESVYGNEGVKSVPQVHGK